MTIAETLRKSVLQAAIQGKLTNQLPDDGNAADLLAEIKAEKARLIKEGKLKKEKPLPEITEDEIPFDIPENWMWCRLGYMSFNNGQKKPSKQFTYIDISSIDNKRNKLGESNSTINAQDAPSRARKIVHEGDIIYATVRPYLHNICIIDREIEPEPIASTGFAVVSTGNKLTNKYLFNVFLSPMFDNYANDSENAKGVAYPAINDLKFQKALIPLPPLSEQKRIVEKIEEILPEIEKLEKNENQLKSIQTVFPAKMKNSILQHAIQGKLTEQLPSDGDANELLTQIKAEKAKLIKEGKLKKEKTLPPISADEIPFEIPENWVWCRLGEISRLVTKGTTPRGGNVAYLEKGIGFLRAENVQGLDKIDKSNIKFISENTHKGCLKRSILDEYDVLVTIAGTLGRTAIVQPDELPLNTNQAISIIRLVNIKSINLLYLIYAINSPIIQGLLTNQKKITAIPNLTLEIISNLSIPLPPLSEQERIVEKLEELLPLCGGLG